MICPNCGYTGWLRVTDVTTPDPYEKCAGISDVRRSWLQCARCTLYYHQRNYELGALKKVYEEGYRGNGLRGVSIEDAHERIMALPSTESENKHRVAWLTQHVSRQQTVVDVGAGLNVFLSELKFFWYTSDFWAVEPCRASVEFIESQGMMCIPTYGGADGWTSELPKADLVTCIHTLEHMEKPWDFLKETRDILKDKGYLFIEVPDAREFDYLEQDNDEFNSCHVWMFNYRTIVDLIEGEGYTVTDMHKVYYPGRNLSRLMVLAKP